MSSEIWIRPTGRVVVLDPAGRVLLLGARGAAGGPVRFWYTPGGGVEGRETPRAAAARELAEEVGLSVAPAALEGPVWLRRHVGVVAGVTIDSRETFFAVRDVVHEVDTSRRTPEEVAGDEPHRWWSRAELDASTLPFAPRDLPALLARLRGGPWSGPPVVVEG